MRGEGSGSRPASRWWLAVVPLVAAVVGYWAWGFASGGSAVGVETADEGEPRLGKLAFELPSLEGGVVRASDYAGQVLVVDFWATWCTPCRLQSSILEGLWEEYKERDVAFLAISLGESPEVVAEFTSSQPFPYPVLVDSEDRLTDALGIYALPTVMVVDREGRISYLRLGISGEQQIRQALAEVGV